MNYKTILKDITNYTFIIKTSDFGAQLTNDQFNEIDEWSKDVDVLQTLRKMSFDKSIIENPDKDEPLNIVNKSGEDIFYQDNTKLRFPRWLCHLLGVRHRCSHAVVVMPNGLLVIQKRSMLKDVYPGVFDVSVGGHVKADSTYEETFFIEMGEELGFVEADTSKIIDIGIYESNVCLPGYNFLSVEARKVFVVELLPSSFDRIKFVDNEVAGVFICDEKEVVGMLATEKIGSGLKYTIPFYMNWKGGGLGGGQ